MHLQHLGLSLVSKVQTGFECFVFEIWVLRALVFVFKCFVFETTSFIQQSQMFVWRFNGISCKSADQLDYGLECLQGICNKTPTLASHGMKFIEIFIPKA